MLTEEEKLFVDYWQRNRLKQKRALKQFLVGIPIGLLFAVPICINFFSGWYTRAAMVSNAGEFNPLVLIIALLIIIAFVALFSKRHQWEMREQHYLEIMEKKSKAGSTPPAENN